MEDKARTIGSSTPKFAKMLSSKYGEMAGTQVVKDLGENHNRNISKLYIQTVSSKVGDIMREKELTWSYAIPDVPRPVESIAIGRDGTTTLIKGDGYRETMVGTLALYDTEGQRNYTMYMASAPEKGKATFNYLLDEQIEKVKTKYPEKKLIGIGDGAKDNWTYLNPRTDVQILDYFHLSEYNHKYAALMYTNEEEQDKWIDWCTEQLFTQTKGSQNILSQMQDASASLKSKSKIEAVNKILTYYHNNKHRMQYKYYLSMNYPIGSGVTEAACKVIVKQRLSCSGMRWTRTSVDDILLTRGLLYSDGRWRQFWQKIDQYGI